MGVPKFYRWLSERYPCLSEVVKEHQIPEFDNLYLDMNGIIHNCSHPNDDDPHFRITEEKIFADIFHYIEFLFRMIQPKKVFFMAIDGVAPRAKMNQQRGRRFRSAKDAELSEKKARDKGEELPTEARFDSNCITPGTPFMCRLHEQLKYFVTMKISTDTLWQNVKVILSGHETPGEGEHKIMDFIRHAKSLPGYDPNIRHCLYGLDADLVMLGLCTHDPHFSLLREEVKFGGRKTGQKSRTVTPENTTFHLLHLSLLREYIDHEFSDLRNSLGFEYSLENIIDDWILMGFLVGNDFLPHLPDLHINKGALSELFNTYKSVLPSLGGYMNINGKLNLPRFEMFLQALAEKEKDRFEEVYSDTKWIEGKTSKKVLGKKHKIVTDTPGPAHVEELLGGLDEGGWEVVPSSKKDVDLMRLIQSTDDFVESSSTEPTDFDEISDSELADSESRDNAYKMEFRQHKREYYTEKMGYKVVTPDVLREQAEGYVLAIQWNLHYYYDGCKSWSWYYKHHYAPWITDIRGFSNMTLVFDIGEPFLPFEQLLSVLPAASKSLLPPILQSLMESPNSPIIEYYPPEFQSDLNGKQQEWEAVVVIPFIDQNKLKEAVTPLFPKMSAEEKGRNKHGPMLEYHFSNQSLGTYPAPQYFRTIEKNLADCKEVWRSDWEVSEGHLQKGLMKGVKLDVYFPGFPTLKHIPHRARLAKEGVKVFEQSSRGDNMMLTILEDDLQSPDQVAKEFLNSEIWVSWPHMVEAKVQSVISKNETFTIDRNGRIQVDQTDKDEFRKNGHVIADMYKTRYGIVIGDTKVILRANVMSGRKYVCGKEGKITLEKIWSKTTQNFALQTTRKDILVHDPSFMQFRTLPELFPDGSTCFVMAYSHYGCEATVLKIDKQHHGRVQLSVIEPSEPCFDEIIDKEKQMRSQYYAGYKAAQKLGISSHLLSRITGTMFVLKGPKEAEVDHAGKVNIGLNLKNNKRGEEVCGFTRKAEDRNWEYSTKALDALRLYMHQWPEVFDYLSTNDRVSGDYFHEADIFPENSSDRLKQLADWIKDQPFANASRQPCGTKTLDENVVSLIEDEITNLASVEPIKKKITMQLKPHLIFKPCLSKRAGAPDQDADFFLFDRVVNVREGFSVPLGLRGTVIGVLKATRQEDRLVEVVFDQEFHGGLALRSSPGKSYRVPRAALINISHGVRMEKKLGNLSEIPQQKSITKEPRISRSWSKEASPALSAKQVTPPDPKSLPTPTDFLASANLKVAKSSNQPSQNMDQLWQSFSSMQVENQPQYQSQPELTPTVAQFFAAQNLGPPPNPPFSQQPPQKSASTSFVPLQVSIKSQKGRGNVSNRGQNQVASSSGTSQRGRGRGRGGGQFSESKRKQQNSGRKLAANFSTNE